MAKQKFYVVWDGAEDGVYTSWDTCKEAVSGYPNAKYKSFKLEEEAEEAFELGYEEWKKKDDALKAMKKESEVEKDSDEAVETNETTKDNRPNESIAKQEVEGPKLGSKGLAIENAIAVDAACSGNPGMMEYRGVYLRTGKEIFHFGPVFGTNNIGEFLAIVHGLALLKRKGLDDMPLYSDSRNAQLWVRQKKCKTTLVRDERTEQLYQTIERAEAWLHNNTWRNQIIKWPTEEWGEIPADFGRK